MKYVIALLVASLATNVWMGSALIRLESYHYASQLGICDPSADIGDVSGRIKREECLNNQQTRTSPLWHLYYALGG